jgi:hypothetical protein
MTFNMWLLFHTKALKDLFRTLVFGVRDLNISFGS